MRYLIISQPKAGTYLCSAILKNLGIHQTYMHLSEDAYNQYYPNKLQEGKYNPDRFRIEIELAESIKLVPPNSFAVTHAQCTEENIELFRDFRKVMLVKDYNAIIRSFSNWLRESRREKDLTIEFRMGIIALRKWCEQEDVFVLDFKHMINKNTQKINELQLHLFGEVKQNSLQLLEQSLSEDTLTKLSRRKKRKR